MFIRGVGPIGYPGAPNGEHAAAGRAPEEGITELPCIATAGISGTSGSPSILNAHRRRQRRRVGAAEDR